MSAREFAKLKGPERAEAIDEIDRVFAQRTGIRRKLDPATEHDLVQSWIGIRDEVLRKRKTSGRSKIGGSGGRAMNRGSGGRGIGGLATQAVSSILPAASDAINAGVQIATKLATDPSWMLIARSQLGQSEFSGSSFNPQILQYILTCSGNLDTQSYGWANKHDWQAWVDKQRKAGLMIPNEKPTNQLKFLIDGEGRGANDEGFEWCAAFVNWCLKRAGINGANHALVSQWSNWGTRLKNPHVGAILIMQRGSNNWGHIAFIDQVDGKWVRLGGNQGAGAVTNATYPKNVTALIWPPGVKSPE